MNPLLKGPAEPPTTRREVELSQLDLRYEGHRLKNAGLEARLLSSIAQRGMDEALEGTVQGASYILLNGFKRFRCARQLHLQVVPFVTLGVTEVEAIFQLLRISNRKSLTLLEQARFLDELKQTRGLSVAEIAAELSRSKAWVSVRLGLIAQLTPALRDALFAGAFPVYSYMYTLREFMRLNGTRREDVEAFVQALRGKKHSVREIEQLAHGFFRGPESFRAEILQGNTTLALQQLNQGPPNPDGYSEFERILLRDLESLQKLGQRVVGKSTDNRLKSRAFFAAAYLSTADLIRQNPVFFQSLQSFHDRCGQA